MTLEDIWAIYNNAYISYQKGDAGSWNTDNAERYSLRKVIEALRDELCDSDMDPVRFRIDCILANDEVKP